jgi:uncharacterized membrane protein YkvA (DUF1232 family)
MNTKTINEGNTEFDSQMRAYMQYMPKEGIDLGQFVERGGSLIGRHRPDGIGCDATELHTKISTVRAQYPRLARQLEFLEDILIREPEGMPKKARNEVVFALLYAVTEADLIPDVMPEIGYTDDAAITELVLLRHAKFFERLCAARQTDWRALKPSISG